jgi:hypothetical protein
MLLSTFVWYFSFVIFCFDMFFMFAWKRSKC